jgi:DNA-binding GntR family transcriptional regulator
MVKEFFMDSATFQLHPVSRERASDSVMQILRESIFSGIFLPGERLNTAELARKLDVSVAPIRDALNRLESEGLIEIRPRSGTFVSSLTAREVRETFEIRAALEGLAVDLAIVNLDREHIAKFRQILRDLEIPVTGEKDRVFHEQKNGEFHSLLVELSGNGKLIQMYRQLKAHITIARVHYRGGNWVARMNKERTEHRRIFAALVARDAEKTKQLIKAHVLGAASRLTEDLVNLSGERSS